MNAWFRRLRIWGRDTDGFSLSNEWEKGKGEREEGGAGGVEKGLDVAGEIGDSK